MTKTITSPRIQVQGDIFGARGCSSSGCSCSPCDCDPCTCGDSLLPDYPEWRMSGYAITTGQIDHVDVSGQIFVSLARPVHERTSNDWYEIILVYNQASPAQISVLLEVFERDLKAMPAEVQNVFSPRRAVYTASLVYTADTEEPELQITFVPGPETLLRGSETSAVKPWNYHGPMALRGHLQS